MPYSLQASERDETFWAVAELRILQSVVKKRRLWSTTVDQRPQRSLVGLAGGAAPGPKMHPSSAGRTRRIRLLHSP